MSPFDLSTGALSDEASAFENAVGYTPIPLPDPNRDPLTILRARFDLFRHDRYDWGAFLSHKHDWRPVPLTQGYFAVVSPKDFTRVMKHKWCANVQRDSQGEITKIYAFRKPTLVEKSRGITSLVYLHRFVASAHYRSRSVIVDHRNGDSLDTRRINLSVTNHLANVGNAVLRPGQLPKGAKAIRPRKNHPDEKRFGARIKIKGKEVWAKTIFTCPQRASRWYMRMHSVIHPEACQVNGRAELPPELVFPAQADDVPF